MHANLTELVYQGKPSQYCIISNFDMPSQSCVISKNSVVSDLTVMRQMHIGHNPVIVPNTRYASILRGAYIEGTEFTNGVVITNFKTRRLTSIFLVLRNFS